MSTSQIHFSSSIEDTYHIAHEFTQLLKGNEIISLEGPLGAGKTHFVKGVALSLGLQEVVTSPTFSLLQTYRTNTQRIHHFDFYRLKNEIEATDLGLGDYFSEGLCFIEWGNKFSDLLPPETCHVRIKLLDDEKREISWRHFNL